MEVKNKKEVPEYMLEQIEMFINEHGVKKYAKSKVGPKKYVQRKGGKKGKWVPRGIK